MVTFERISDNRYGSRKGNFEVILEKDAHGNGFRLYAYTYELGEGCGCSVSGEVAQTCAEKIAGGSYEHCEKRGVREFLIEEFLVWASDLESHLEQFKDLVLGRHDGCGLPKEWPAEAECFAQADSWELAETVASA